MFYSHQLTFSLLKGSLDHSDDSGNDYFPGRSAEDSLSEISQIERTGSY